MALLNFPFNADRRPTKATKSTTRNIQFGDGYMQRINNNIHNFETNYSVTFNNRSAETIDAIVAFFEARNGVEAFMYDGKKVICQSWNEIEITPTIKSANAQFQVVYE